MAAVLSAVVLLATPQLMEAKNSPSISPVVYTLADGTRLTGYLSVPPDYRQGEKYPAILLIHGYRGVSRNRPQGLAAGWLKLKPHKKHLLQHYVVFSAEFYADHLGERREFESIAVALKTMASLPQIDPQRIAALGPSRGGYLTLMSMMYPGMEPRPKTGVSICAITDVAEWVKYLQGQKDNPRLLPGLRQFSCTTIPQIMGWPPNKDQRTREKFARISVLPYVKNLQGPIMLIHGDKDIQVPVSQAHLLRKVLQQEQKNHEYLEVPGGGHFIFQDDEAMWEKIDEYLKRTL